jgi:formate/nitrite transporter
VRKPFTPDEIVQAVERALSAPPSAHALDGVERLADKLEKATPVAEHFENRTPAAVTRMVMKSVGVNKARAPLASVTVLGVLAGVYIGFGAAMATLVGHDAAKYIGVGLAQVFTGAVFSVGLMLVVLAGAELFTGNNLMVVSVLGREYGWGRMLGRWALVYAANFAGSVLLAWLMFRSGLWKTASNAVGARALAIANAKVSLPFEEAFFRGIGCNWLVCLAVWMALSSKDVAGKILAVFFPIMAFVALGFEHCVANMYFVPLGIFLKGSAVVSGLDVQPLTWGRFLVANLVPVTLGNVVGGGLFVGALYWFSYARGGPAPKPASSN